MRAIVAAEVEEELGHRSEPYPCAGADGTRKATDRGMRFGTRGTPLHMCAWIVCVPAVLTEGLGRARVVSNETPVSILIPEDAPFPRNEQAEVVGTVANTRLGAASLAAGCKGSGAA